MFKYLSVALCLAAGVFGSLRSDLSGKSFSVVFPDSPSYQNASQAFNLRFTFKPAAITFPNNPQDISQIIKTSTQYNFQVVARSGGHSYIANGLGGKDGVVVVDLRAFNKVTVDSSTGVATIETGNRLGNIALALNDHGRALPHGTCPYVGIGGHSGYGGYGFTSRKWGLTLDTITSINVVLANGTITTASANTNPDLFWALRGSSGSFGITTSITVNTFPAPPSATVFEYHWTLNASAAAQALGAFQTYVLGPIPQEFGAELVLTKGPSKGMVAFGLTGGYYGSADKVNSTLAPFLRTVPKPHDSKFTVGTYINSVNYLGGAGTLNTSSKPDGHDTFYAKSLMTPEDAPMTVAAQSAFMTYLANEGFSSNTDWFVEVELYGGPGSAINAVSHDATAFVNRNSVFTIQFYASSSNALPPFPASGLTFLDGMVNSIVNNNPSNWSIGAYPNYIDNRLSNWQALYYGDHYARLHGLKDVYDPKDTFNFPTAIEV